MNRTTNGEAEKGLRKQNDLVPRRSVDGRCGNSVIDGASARICFDEKCKETFVAGCSSSKPNAVSESVNLLITFEVYDC